MTEISSPYPTQTVVKKKSKTPLIIAVVVILALIIGGIFLLRKPEQPVQPEVTVSETPEPSPTEAPTVDKATVKIQVQNGTGTPGQAGKVVDVLKKSGFAAENIKTGNASEFKTMVTTISAKEGFGEVAKEIKSSLADTFDEIKIDSTTLDADGEFDLVIITGGKLYEEPTSAVTSAPTSATTVTPSPTASPTPTP